MGLPKAAGVKVTAVVKEHVVKQLICTHMYIYIRLQSTGSQDPQGQSDSSVTHTHARTHTHTFRKRVSRKTNKGSRKPLGSK